jgi:hypothetical protein
VYPRASNIWYNNDQSLSAFILNRISREDYDTVIAVRNSGAYHVFTALKKRHEQLGLHAQVLAIREALDVRFDPATSLDDTLTELRAIHTKVVSMGPMDDDKLFTVFIIHALGDRFPQLQSSIQSMTTLPNFSSAVVAQRIHEEHMLIRRRTELTGATALVATNKERGNRPTCSLCNRNGHSIDFCISPGGKMAGKTVEEARDAQTAHRAAKKAARAANKPREANVATANNTASSVPSPTTPTTTLPTLPASNAPSPIVIHGITYYPGQSAPVTSNVAQIAMTTTANGMPDPSAGFFTPSGQYFSYLALGENTQKVRHACVDWNLESSPVDLSKIDASPAAFTTSRPVADRLEDRQFVLDTGATCHISPERSDFKTLVATAQVPITGVGGSVIHAVGVGTVELHIASNNTLILRDVLFVPASTVRLISVMSLNESGPYGTYFDPTECYVTDKSKTIIARGVASKSRRLYLLTAPVVHVTRIKPQSTAFMSTARIPNVETWHRRLGHCSAQTVIDMARSHSVEGMPIDLSTAPPKCDICILGKQTRTPVPKVREGKRATRRLERVHVDLCGPMSVLSRSGRRYSMNIVDDFSGYVWSIPLRSKDEAAPVLQDWHRAVENRSGERLKILVTDNGELVSHAMTEWCSANGIEHQLTAPYTSAQNGRAERVHRTLLSKARAMRFACYSM